VAALETILKVILALAAVAFVGYPFLQQKRESAPRVTPEHETLLERKTQVDAALQEVEFDYRTGKLPEKDFHDLTARFLSERTEVASLLGLPQPAEDSGAAPGPSVPASAVSAEEPSAVARAATAATARPTQNTCPACRTLNPAGAKFCGSCGAPMGAAPSPGRKAREQQAAVCARCGAELRPSNKFCGSCGAKT
jgi:hypothetical protein